MKVSLKYNRLINDRLKYLLELVHKDISECIIDFLNTSPEASIDEIRMHLNSKLVIMSRLSSIITHITVSKEHINKTLVSLCKGSVYSYFNSINEGYINVGQGIRVGICGRATVQGGAISGISDISSLNIRIPKRIPHAGDYLYDLILAEDFKSSVILYSPPGIGKTTILRELISRISAHKEHIRVCIIDTREELSCGMDEKISSDCFLSYPKGEAIIMATRTMSPELIICDEISTPSEANAVLNGVNCGVCFIASTHASNIKELKNKSAISSLIANNVFKYALGVNRERGSSAYEYELTEL